jgi:hypothetical protein
LILATNGNDKYRFTLAASPDQPQIETPSPTNTTHKEIGNGVIMLPRQSKTKKKEQNDDAHRLDLLESSKLCSYWRRFLVYSECEQCHR